MKTTIMDWIPVVLLMMIASFLRLRSSAAPNYYLLAGSDGPYYPLQVRSMFEHFHLAIPDMPLLFAVDGVLAKVLQFLHLGSAEDCILISIRVTNTFLPPLAAIPVFLIAKEFNPKPSLLSYLIVAFTILSFTPVVLFSNSVLQKNALAVVWVFFYLYFVLRFLKYGLKKDVYYGLLLLLLCALTHYGSFGLLVVFSIFAGAFWLANYKGHLVLRKIAIVASGFLIALCLIAVFDPQRFVRLISAPLNLFRAPVILFALEGRNILLTGPTLMILIIVNVLALFALILLILRRKQLSIPDKAFALGLTVLTLILSSPIYGLEYANRLFMMSYVPLSILYLFLFNYFRSVWIKVIPALAFSWLMLFSLVTSMIERRPVSITDNAFSEFKQLNRTVPFSAQSVIVSRQDLRLLGSWVFGTKNSAENFLADADFDKYDGVYLIRQIDGNNLRAARYRQPVVPSNSLLVFKGNYFEVYKLSKGAGWNTMKGKFQLINGTITDIRGDRLVISPGFDGNPSTVEFSPNTTIHLSRQDTKLSIGMHVEVWGNFKPFSLTVVAETINED